MQTTDYSKRVTFVMLEPSHAGNIGAAARALRSMGFSDLRIISPRDPQFASNPDALAFASGASEILASAGVFSSLQHALHDVTYAVGLSAYGREFAAPIVELQQILPKLPALLLAEAEARIAFVFGTERTGMSIGQAQMCQALCYLESHPETSSLNVAQSMQVVAYSARLALGLRRHAEVVVKDPGDASVTVEQVQAMLEHFEQALVAIEFLDPKQPKRLMPRLSRLFNRTTLQRAELDIFRGIAGAMLKLAERKKS